MPEDLYSWSSRVRIGRKQDEMDKRVIIKQQRYELGIYELYILADRLGYKLIKK